MHKGSLWWLLFGFPVIFLVGHKRKEEPPKVILEVSIMDYNKKPPTEHCYLVENGADGAHVEIPCKPKSRHDP